jgi:HK97 family phage prohead protease
MLERREIRQAAAEGRTLSGYAAVFNSPSEPLQSHRGEFIETIAPGAFKRSLDGTVWAYYNHDTAWPLARTPDTMSLAEDRVGLRMSLQLPETTYGHDVAALMQAGVLDGSMSFGFRSREDRWERRDGMLHRTLLDVDLVEISIVQEPAYKAPRSSLRGVDLDTSRRRLALRIRAAAGSVR